MTGQADHGLAPTPEIAAKDGEQPGQQPQPAKAADPTQGGKTLPIGGADGQNGALSFPDGFPDQLKGQDYAETLAKTFTAYNGARTELASSRRAPALPKSAGDYAFEWPDDMKGTIASDDAAVQLFRDIAFEHKFSQDQIAAIPAFFAKAKEAGLFPQDAQPIDLAQLDRDLAPADFKGTDAERQVRGSQRLGEADNWISQLPAAQFDDAVKNELRMLTMSVDGVRAIEALQRAGMISSVQPGGGAAPAGVTKETLESRIADPRNNSQDPKFNEDFAKETRRLYKQMYGG